MLSLVRCIYAGHQLNLTVMFKIKAWIFTPQVVICYVLLLTILAFVAKPATVHYDKDTDGVVREYEEPNESGLYDTHTLTWKDMKSYQLEITMDGKYVIMYDYDRVVGVLPLDNKCNLTMLIEMDND